MCPLFAGGSVMSRHQRVEEAIRKEVSLIIHDELKDPRIGFITITRVELTRDLRFAKIFYSVLGKEEEHKKTRLALDSALGYIRSLVAQRINLRIATELMLKEDHSTEYSVRIEEVLNQIKEIDEPKKGLRKRKKI
jgi:ribosome-binding factor A